MRLSDNELNRQYVEWGLEMFRRVLDEAVKEWKTVESDQKFFGLIEESVKIDDHGAILTIVPLEGFDIDIYSALRMDRWNQEEYRDDENWITEKNQVLIQYSKGRVEIYMKGA